MSPRYRDPLDMTPAQGRALRRRLAADQPTETPPPLTSASWRHAKRCEFERGTVGEHDCNCGLFAFRSIAPSSLPASSSALGEALRTIRAELVGFSEPYAGAEPNYQHGKQYGLQLAIGAIDSRLDALAITGPATESATPTEGGPDDDWTLTCPHGGDDLCVSDSECRCECHSATPAEGGPE